MFVKICGMNSREAVEAAVAAGADALGFVFAPSVRQVTPEQALELCAGLPAQVIRVAVMRHPELEEWQQVATQFAPDWLQTDAADFDDLTLPPGCRALPVYRNGRTPATTGIPARMLFEGAVSGSGRLANWNEAAALARQTELVLAGGLDAHNVPDAMRRVSPWGVDVSSGVESAPGHKDPVQIAMFIARVRATESSA